jgi:hypothetical protein
MRLSEYQWSLNPRGMHTEGVYRGPKDRERTLRMQMGWYKFVVAGEDGLNDCVWCLSNNITPIVRVYRPRQLPAPPDDYLITVWRLYASIGVKWFEFYNEPNLAYEWPIGAPFDFRDRAQVIAPMMESWLSFAEIIIGLGCYPAFPALTEAATAAESAIFWMDAMLAYLRDVQRGRFLNVLNRGMWFAAHPSTLNHFYQETPGQPWRPRLPSEQVGTEGGWHFEYPYDPICQATDPGRTVFGGTPTSPYGDPNGITAMGRAFMQRLAEWFNAGPVPLVGTEGGVYPVPVQNIQQPDMRYPHYDSGSHGEATIAMFNWIITNAAPWHFGICLWKEDEYYHYNLAALFRMEQVPQLRRTREQLEGLIGFGETGLGPGPLKGEPTYHVVILAPGLEPRWFFETAQPYWNRYRPIVTTGWNFMSLIPNTRSLAATIIAPPDVVDSVKHTLVKQYPNVYLDIILASGDLGNVANVLNGRVWANRRFG